VRRQRRNAWVPRRLETPEVPDGRRRVSWAGEIPGALQRRVCAEWASSGACSSVWARLAVAGSAGGESVGDDGRRVKWHVGAASAEGWGQGPGGQKKLLGPLDRHREKELECSTTDQEARRIATCPTRVGRGWEGARPLANLSTNDARSGVRAKGPACALWTAAPAVCCRATTKAKRSASRSLVWARQKAKRGSRHAGSCLRCTTTSTTTRPSGCACVVFRLQARSRSCSLQIALRQSSGSDRLCALSAECPCNHSSSPTRKTCALPCHSTAQCLPQNLHSAPVARPPRSFHRRRITSHRIAVVRRRWSRRPSACDAHVPMAMPCSIISDA
jgi:hypothetical protein